MNPHHDTRELLELAAIEPGGLGRLEAGDTPESALVAGHLAGCAACLEEAARLRLADSLIRPIIAEAPDPSLRARTLAAVRELGIARGPGAAPSPRPDGLGASVPAVGYRHAPESPGTAATPGRGRALGGLPAWVTTLAAGLVLGLVGGAMLVGGRAPAGNADPEVALQAIARETATLAAAGDAREVILVDATGRPAGMLMLSPSAGRIVMSATGLATPAERTEYRCWVEVGDRHSVIGTLWHAGSVAWWVGEVALPAHVPPGTRYGVSRVDGGSPGPGSVVLTGEL